MPDRSAVDDTRIGNRYVDLFGNIVVFEDVEAILCVWRSVCDARVLDEPDSDDV